MAKGAGGTYGGVPRQRGIRATLFRAPLHMRHDARIVVYIAHTLGAHILSSDLAHQCSDIWAQEYNIRYLPLTLAERSLEGAPNNCGYPTKVSAGAPN